MSIIDSIKQLYRHRDLTHVLTIRDLKARYHGTFFGFLWTLLNPLLLTLTYTIVFSKVLRVDMPNFHVFVLAGVLPWLCFSSTITESSMSILTNGGLIRKVALPSEMFPLICVGTNMVHCLLGSLVLIVIMIFSGIPVSWTLVLFPIILIVQVLFSYGLALLMAALTVQFRDLYHMAPNFMTVWFFITPIAYPATMVPESLRSLVWINPMTSLIQAYQDVFYYGRPPSATPLLLLTLLAILLLAVGLSFFDARREFMAEEV